MINKNGAAWLANEIKQLEQKEAVQLQVLKQLRNETLEKLKPSALFKSTIKSAVTSKNFKHSLIDTSIGIGAGLLFKRWFPGNTSNVFRKLTGFVLQNLTTGVVAKKMPGIREKITSLFTK